MYNSNINLLEFSPPTQRHDPKLDPFLEPFPFCQPCFIYLEKKVHIFVYSHRQQSFLSTKVEILKERTWVSHEPKETIAKVGFGLERDRDSCGVTWVSEEPKERIGQKWFLLLLGSTKFSLILDICMGPTYNHLSMYQMIQTDTHFDTINTICFYIGWFIGILNKAIWCDSFFSRFDLYCVSFDTKYYGC